MTQKEALEQLINDLSEFSIDHLKMMGDAELTPEQIKRWRQNRDKLHQVEKDFDNFLLIRAGKEPIF